VLWHGRGRREFLAIEEKPGTILARVLHPGDQEYKPQHSSSLLRQYGEMLGRVHTLPVEWEEQRRAHLYGFIGEEEVEDSRFEEIVLWLRINPVERAESVFVHGDMNTANVLTDRGTITGILDWEFAGMGWREYDLAWVLRQRKHYLKSPHEREELLNGYRSVADYDVETLRWCEVLNYLHIAFWVRDRFPNYTSFALTKAREAMFRGFE
jgi:aminoglycoside phosphotransferase (APT) family kinase protein